MNTAVVLINVGTPDKPEVKYVRKYLFEFLNDRRVIDLPLLLQKFLVNVIIVPFRAPKSTKLYKILWRDDGSPLLSYTIKLKDKLQKKLGSGYDVYAAMSYGNPSLKDLLKNLGSKRYDRIIFVPLFPQYASSTTGSVLQLINKEISRWYIIPDVKIINQFYDHPAFIGAFAKRIESYKPKDYDHIIFSYHGLPLSQIRKSHPDVNIETCSCEIELPGHGHYCYKATCYETTRLLAKALNLPPNKYTVSFQSRLTKDWLNPFTDDVILEKAKSGIKKILIIAPSFVTDCLETIVELGIEYGNLFKSTGGVQLDLVESLNDSDGWVDALMQIIAL